MSKIDTVRAAMMQAMKDKNKERKDALQSAASPRSRASRSISARI